MSESSAAIGLASASRGAPPPKCSASSLLMKDQVTASTMPRAASARRASDTRFCARVSTGFSTVASLAREGRRGHAVEPFDARDLLDEIGLAFDVGAPGRRR